MILLAAISFVGAMVAATAADAAKGGGFGGGAGFLSVLASGARFPQSFRRPAVLKPVAAHFRKWGSQAERDPLIARAPRVPHKLPCPATHPML